MGGRHETQPQRYLALFRAGPDSLHPKVVSGWEDQNFHYAVSWFGAEPPSEEFVAGAQFVDLAPQPSKTLGLEHTLATHWPVISEYDFVWLPDDDLMMEPADLSEFFEACSTLQLDLAQPAVRQDSYVTHAVTAVHEGFQVRFTNFVEVMAPAFSRRLLAQVRPTLHGALTAWGLDHLWRHMAPLGNIAIVDMAPVAHTRKFQEGVGYKVMEGTGLTVDDDLARTLLRYNLVPEGHRRITYGGLLNDGSARDPRRPTGRSRPGPVRAPATGGRQPRPGGREHLPQRGAGLHRIPAAAVRRGSAAGEDGAARSLTRCRSGRAGDLAIQGRE